MMITHIRLSILIIPLAGASLFPAQPAPALQGMAQPHLGSSWEDSGVVQLIGQRRCYGYRDGRRVYRPCPPRSHYKPKRKSGSYGTTQSTGGYHKPWGGHEPCANCPTAR